MLQFILLPIHNLSSCKYFLVLHSKTLLHEKLILQNFPVLFTRILRSPPKRRCPIHSRRRILHDGDLMRREWKTGKAKRQKQTEGKSSVPGSAKAARTFNLEAGVKKRKSGGGGHAVGVERPHKSGFPRRQVKKDHGGCFIRKWIG